MSTVDYRGMRKGFQQTCDHWGRSRLIVSALMMGLLGSGIWFCPVATAKSYVLELNHRYHLRNHPQHNHILPHGHANTHNHSKKAFLAHTPHVHAHHAPGHLTEGHHATGHYTSANHHSVAHAHARGFALTHSALAHYEAHHQMQVQVERMAQRNSQSVSHADSLKPTNGLHTIAPGVRHISLHQQSAAGPLQIQALEIDPKNPSVEIMPVLASNRMGAKSSVSSMVTSYQAVAGVNGSFFKPDVGTPLGLLIRNQELISGPLYERVALGITPDNELVMARIRFGGSIALPDGRILVHISNVNQPRIRSDSAVIYSSRWGNLAPRVPMHGMQIQLTNHQVTAVSITQPLPIPKDGIVVSGPSTREMVALSEQPITQKLQLNVYTLPDWSGIRHGVGGGPWLVKDGRAYIDLQAQHFNSHSLGYREPRSAVGITREGKLLLVTVDGRQKKVSVGMTLPELASLMQRLGAVNAMNLDGGSSTQMSIYGQTVNRPSAGNVGVSNSLVVCRKNPGDRLAHVDIDGK